MLINQVYACTGDNSQKRMIPMIAKTLNISTGKAVGVLNCVVCNMAIEINTEKLNCAEDRHICWTTYQNLSLWFDSWEVFLVDYGFATISQTGELIVAENTKKRILNMDETCLSLDRSNSNCGGHPTVTYYDFCFPQLGKATSKSALTTTMISGSTAVGEPLIPHFQFQTLALTAKAEAIRIEMICYMLDVRGAFGYEDEQSFPTVRGLNKKGGLDDDEFFEYLKKLIMKLYFNAAPVKGR